MNVRQIGPLTGILFVALLIASFIVGGSTPGIDDSPQKIASFYNDHDTRMGISGLLLGVAVVAFLFFLTTLRRSLRAVTTDEGGLSTAVLVGGIIFAVGGSTFA